MLRILGIVLLGPVVFLAFLAWLTLWLLPLICAIGWEMATGDGVVLDKLEKIVMGPFEGLRARG